MYIQSGLVEPHVVSDFDFTFDNGLFMTITVDENVGDSIDLEATPTKAIVKLVEKPSKTDPSATVPAETITIYIPHVIMIQHHSRVVIPASPEQRDEFKQSLFQLSKSSH